MKFSEFINEKNKLMGKLKAHEKILYDAYIEFLKDYFNVNKDIEISFRKPSKNKYFGFIDLVSFSKNKYKIIVENIPYGILGKIGHEFTHVSQYIHGKLTFTEDLKYIIWKGEQHNVKTYNNISDINEYKKLGWEKEAYYYQDILPYLFKKSKFLSDIKGKNDTIDFMIDNDLIS